MIGNCAYGRKVIKTHACNSWSRKGEKLGNDGGMIMRNDADPGKGREKHYPLVLLNKDLVYESRDRTMVIYG